MLDIATIETLATMWSDDPQDTGPEGGEYDIHVWLTLAAEYTRRGLPVGDDNFNTEWLRRVTN